MATVSKKKTGLAEIKNMSASDKLFFTAMVAGSMMTTHMNAEHMQDQALNPDYTPSPIGRSLANQYIKLNDSIADYRSQNIAEDPSNFQPYSLFPKCQTKKFCVNGGLL